MQQDFFNAQPKNKVGADVQPNFFSSGEPCLKLGYYVRLLIHKGY